MTEASSILHQHIQNQLQIDVYMYSYEVKARVSKMQSKHIGTRLK